MTLSERMRKPWPPNDLKGGGWIEGEEDRIWGWADEVATLERALRLARDKLVSPNTSSYITDEIDAALRGIPLSEFRPTKG